MTHRCFCNPVHICIRFGREVKKFHEERPSSCLSMRNSAINPQVFPSSSQFFRGYDFLLRVYVANGKLSLKTLTNTIHTTEFWSFVIYKIASPNTPIYGVHFCCNEYLKALFVARLECGVIKYTHMHTAIFEFRWQPLGSNELLF